MMEKIEVSVMIPTQLLAFVDLHFFDPAIGKPTYGARSKLIVGLLKEWKEGIIKSETPDGLLPSSRVASDD